MEPQRKAKLQVLGAGGLNGSLNISQHSIRGLGFIGSFVFWYPCSRLRHSLDSRRLFALGHQISTSSPRKAGSQGLWPAIRGVFRTRPLSCTPVPRFSHCITIAIDPMRPPVGSKLPKMCVLETILVWMGWSPRLRTWVLWKNSLNLGGFFQVHFDVSFCSGFTATMDLPMNLFAPAMAERRPSSKVIMTVRPRIKWSEISFSWRSENFCFVFLVPNFAGLKKSGCHHGPTWMTSCRFLVARPWSWLVDMTFNQQLLKAIFCGYAYSMAAVYSVYMSSICSSVVWWRSMECAGSCFVNIRNLMWCDTLYCDVQLSFLSFCRCSWSLTGHIHHILFTSRARCLGLRLSPIYQDLVQRRDRDCHGFLQKVSLNTAVWRFPKTGSFAETSGRTGNTCMCSGSGNVDYTLSDSMQFEGALGSRPNQTEHTSTTTNNKNNNNSNNKNKNKKK